MPHLASGPRFRSKPAGPMGVLSAISDVLLGPVLIPRSLRLDNKRIALLYRVLQVAGGLLLRVPCTVSKKS